MHLNVTFEPSSADATVVPRTDCGLPLLVGRDRWLRLAEQVIGGWAPTLRVALLMMVAFVGLVVLVGVAFGFSGVILGAAVSGALYFVGRSALPARAAALNTLQGTE